MKKISVLFVITGLSAGGAENMLFKILQGIDRRRFNPVVVSLADGGSFGSKIEALGIPVYCLGMRPGFSGIFKIIHLVKLMRTLRPDIVQTWMYHADLIGGLAARVSGISRLVWGIRHSDLSEDKNKKSTLCVVEICAKLSKWIPRYIISCSFRAMSAHVNFGYCSERFFVVPNGFDLGMLVPDRDAKKSLCRELSLGENVKFVGLIARFDPLKNHFGFVEAAAFVAKECSGVHFVLVGTGVDSNNIELQERIHQYGIEDRMHLLGYRQDIPRLMAALDALASPSYGEAFPNVLGEAMACGVPCVVTDVGDSAEIVGATGRVVAPGDMAGLARELVSVLQLSTEEKADLGEKARARVAANYEIGHVIELYQSFYERVFTESKQGTA